MKLKPGKFAALLVAGVAAICVALSLVGSAQAATVHTIPGTDLSVVKSANKLDISSATYSRHEFHGVSGTVSYFQDGQFGTTTVFCVPVSASSVTTLNNFLDIYFTNVGQLNGRSLNVTLHCTQLVQQPNGTDTSCGIILLRDPAQNVSGGPGYECEIGSIYEGYGAIGHAKTVDIHCDVTYADTGETINLPFYQSISDLDVLADNFFEGWEGLTGYTGDLFVYGTNDLTIRGMQVRVKDDGRSGEHITDGDDSYLKAGVFAPTTTGSINMRFYSGGCGTTLTLYSPYSNLKHPTKAL